MGPLRKIGRLLVVLLSMLALGEVATRLLLTSPSAQQADDELGWTYRPHALVFSGREGGAVLRANALGLIDDELTPADGRLRVAVFGDSLTESLQVPLPVNFTSVLEARLADLDVVNLGRSDMSPAHYPTVAGRLLPVLEPDLLVVTISPGDVVDLTREDVVATRDEAGALVSVALASRGSDRLKALAAPVITRSALATHLMRRAKPTVQEFIDTLQSLRALASGGGASPNDDAEDDAVDEAGRDARTAAVGREVIERLAWVLDELEGSGIPVVLLNLSEVDYRPGGEASDATPRETKWYRLAALRAGVPFLDTVPHIVRRYQVSGQPGHGFANLRIGVGHLNSSGHQAVADTLGAYLREEWGREGRASAR